MKKDILLVYVSILITGATSAQKITQSAEGTGTVIMEGSTISLDLGKTDLSFGWNNLRKSVVGKNNGPLYGGEVKVKNAEGIGSLFSKGELVPQGSLNFFLGKYFSNAISSIKNSPANQFDTPVEGAEETKYLERKKELLKKAASLLEVIFLQEIDAIAKAKITTIAKITPAVDAVKAEYELIPEGQKLFFPVSFNASDADIEIAAFRAALKARLLAVKKQVEIPYRELSNARHLSIVKFNKNRKGYYKITGYFFGGINSIDFKRFEKIDSSNLENSFKDEYFRGGHFGVGINIEYWRFRFGLTYAYTKTSNFSALSSSEYTLQSSTVINNQTLQSKNTITAYGGTKFGAVEKNELNIDIIYNCKLDKDAENHLLINPYLRASLFSRDTSLLINKTDIGIGGYFFKQSGKFLGGIYLELPDVNNNAEKKKPADKQNLRPPLGRLSFGIVTKFSLKALFGW